MCVNEKLYAHVAYSDLRLRDFWRAYVSGNWASERLAYQRALLFGVEPWDGSGATPEDLLEYKESVRKHRYYYSQGRSEWRATQVQNLCDKLSAVGLTVSIDGTKAHISLDRRALDELDVRLINSAKLEGLPAIILGNCFLSEYSGIPLLHCDLFGPKRGRVTNYGKVRAFVVGRLDIKVPPYYPGGIPTPVGRSNIKRVCYTLKQAHNFAAIVDGAKDAWLAYDTHLKLEEERQLETENMNLRFEDISDEDAESLINMD